jgi:hypothetical protein
MALKFSANKELSLVGPIQLEHFQFKTQNVAMDEISGELPVSENIKLSPFGFVRLLTENPFERVQFEQIRPLLNESHPLRIERIHWLEKQYGPLIGFASLDQNRFFIHQLDLNMLAGQVYGEMFADIEPHSLQAGFLGRISNLDLAIVLPKKFTKRQQVQSNILSARAGLVLNVNKNSLTGRLDVTKLGSEQLISLMNTLDPDYKNEKFNKMRGLLKLGYPTGIFAAFANGYMDLGVDLSLIGLNNHQSLNAIPISSLIAKSLSGLLQKKPQKE